MAKTVKKKTEKPLEIKTPYPKEVKANQQKSDTDYWGEKMVKLQDRINELELSVNDMHLKLTKVADRLGM